jgi:hypothetical protein
LINSLAGEIAFQSKTIENLQSEIKKASSFRGQWTGWVYGAVIGIVLSELLKLFLA